FSKIGGEMVPHIRVEEEIMKIIQAAESKADQETDDEQDIVAVAVTAVPDARKGERLVVLHTGLPEEPEAICRQLAAAGLPPIWIPSPASFRQIDRMPVLGTGKLDLKGIKEKALEQFADGK
ncbi:MAG TPA: acyl-[ACP]--phospholipid O-acyltransferase, partial [Thermoguttaceae bacterium]|nr:acyl-[ACP]--phospholipid O-acyltransferase [Thermoguttaceae bacterium]